MIKTFNHIHYGKLRATMEYDSPYFCLKDVCTILKIKSVPTVRKHLDEQAMRHFNVLTGAILKPALFVDVDNLNHCLFHSQAKEAEDIFSWVYHKVIPKLRKLYEVEIDKFRDEDYVIAFVDEHEDLKTRVKVMELDQMKQAPKIKTIDQLMGTNNCTDLDIVSNVLKYRGIGRNTLLKILRAYNILDVNNIPYQEFCDKKYFRVVYATTFVANHNATVKRTYVYQSGIALIERTLKRFDADKQKGR